MSWRGGETPQTQLAAWLDPAGTGQSVLGIYDPSGPDVPPEEPEAPGEGDGEEEPDEGTVSIPKRTTIGYFRQDAGESSERSVLDEAIAGCGALGTLHHELEELEAEELELQELESEEEAAEEPAEEEAAEEEAPAEEEAAEEPEEEAAEEYEEEAAEEYEEEVAEESEEEPVAAAPVSVPLDIHEDVDEATAQLFADAAAAEGDSADDGMEGRRQAGAP